MGLSLSDCINNGGYLFAGIYRIRLLFKGIHNTMENAWTCMLTVHNLCFSTGVTLSTMMLTVVSCDRLLCVLSPLGYLGWTVTYARSFIASVYIFNTIGVIYAYVSTYGSDIMVSSTCVSPTIIKLTTHRIFALYFTRSPQLYAITSVSIYVLVAILYKRMNTIVFSEHPNHKYELKRQRKVTVTLLLSAVCTLFLYVIPYYCAAYANENGYNAVAILMWTFSNRNVFLYPLRHKEIKQALFAMAKCKTMPSNLTIWKATAQQPAQETRRAPKYMPRDARVGPAPRLMGRMRAASNMTLNVTNL